MNKTKIILLLSMVCLTALSIGPLKVFATPTCTASYFTCHSGEQTCYTWSCTNGETGTYCTNGLEDAPYEIVPADPPPPPPPQLFYQVVGDPCLEEKDIEITCQFNFASYGGGKTQQSLSIFKGGADVRVTPNGNYFDLTKATKIMTGIATPASGSPTAEMLSLMRGTATSTSGITYTDENVTPGVVYYYICRKDMTLAEIQAKVDTEQLRHDQMCARRGGSVPCPPYVPPPTTSVDAYYDYIYTDPVMIAGAVPYTWQNILLPADLPVPYYCRTDCETSCGEDGGQGSKFNPPNLTYQCGEVSVKWSNYLWTNTDSPIRARTLGGIFRGLTGWLTGLGSRQNGTDITTEYNIFKSSSSNGEYVKIGSVSGDKNIFKDPVSDPGTYYYKVERLYYNDKSGDGYRSISAAEDIKLTEREMEIKNLPAFCSSLPAEDPISPSCTLSMTNPTSGPVNVNTETTWTVSSSFAGVKTWTISDSNSTTTITVSDSAINTLDKIFTTIGTKTISVELSSSTAPDITGIPCTATTTIVQEGGSSREI